MLKFIILLGLISLMVPVFSYFAAFALCALTALFLLRGFKNMFEQKMARNAYYE